MEWLWWVDETDEPLGRVERTDAHARAVRHRAGVVLLRDAEGGVYLTRRASSKAIFPNTYDTSASFHVTHGESYQDAAQREALEELGLARPLRALGKVRHDDPPEHQFVMVFVMDYRGETIALDPREAASGRFYSRMQAEQIVREQASTPWLRDALALLTSSSAW